MADYTVAPLGPRHNRASFDSGSEALDRYFRQKAGQDVRNSVARCFVMTHEPSGQIVGYYTLSSYGVAPDQLPPEIARRLPRYDLLPAVLLGRLAVDRRFQGQGLGRRLLFSALNRVLGYTQEVAVYAIVVDAKDEAVAAFYQHYDFIAFADQPLRLFLPVRLIAQGSMNLSG